MQKRVVFFILLTVISVGIFSCGDNNHASGSTAPAYYPVEKFIADEIDSLYPTTDIWVKTVSSESDNETSALSANKVDWKTELALFYDLAPNKKGYAGKLKIDTTIKDSITTVTYTSADQKLRMLTIMFDKNNHIKAIYGDLVVTNLFYRSMYELSFIPDKAYAINGKQTMAFFGSEEQFSIQWIKEPKNEIDSVADELSLEVKSEQ